MHAESNILITVLSGPPVKTTSFPFTISFRTWMDGCSLLLMCHSHQHENLILLIFFAYFLILFPIPLKKTPSTCPLHSFILYLSRDFFIMFLFSISSITLVNLSFQHVNIPKSPYIKSSLITSVHISVLPPYLFNKVIIIT